MAGEGTSGFPTTRQIAVSNARDAGKTGGLETLTAAALAAAPSAELFTSTSRLPQPSHDCDIQSHGSKPRLTRAGPHTFTHTAGVRLCPIRQLVAKTGVTEPSVITMVSSQECQKLRGESYVSPPLYVTFSTSSLDTLSDIAHTTVPSSCGLHR